MLEKVGGGLMFQSRERVLKERQILTKQSIERES